MALDLLGFDRYTVIPVFVLCFFKTGLLYHSLNISFKQQRSLREMNGWPRRGSLSKGMAEEGNENTGASLLTDQGCI